MTGNPGLDKIILGLNGAVVIAATSLIIYSHMFIKTPKTDAPSEFGNMIENSVMDLQKPPVVMEEIVVNLYSRETRLRFLDTQINLIIFNEKDRELVMSMKPRIFDHLIDIAGNMKPEELNSITGRILLETRIKKGLMILNKNKNKNKKKKIKNKK